MDHEFMPRIGQNSQLPPAESQSPRARRLTLAAMSCGYAVVQLDITIVNTALASIGASVGGGVAELQWVVGAYTIAFAATILTAGAAGDRIGAKRVFMSGFALFTAASCGCALAPTALTLILARAVQGVGAAMLVPNSLALLNHTYHDARERGRAVGIWAAGASLALTAGPLVGGGLIALVGWRAIFLVNLPVGLIALWVIRRHANETMRQPDRELDLPGQISAIAGLACMAGALIEGGVLGWSNSFVLSGFLASALLVALFVARERRARQPMLPLSLFRDQWFARLSLVGLFVNVGFYGLIFILSMYFQQIAGWSPFATGLAFLPMMGAVLPVNLLAPLLAERFGDRAVIAAGAALAAVGCAGLLGITRDTTYPAMAAQLVALGAGLGLLVPPLTAALLGSVDKARSGIAAGVLNAIRQTGSVLGVALFGSLVSHANAFLPGARASLVISTLLLLGGGATILCTRTGERRPAPGRFRVRADAMRNNSGNV
jgi:DHA2 family methylenomycin A resistance protein-like MFS transporter